MGGYEGHRGWVYYLAVDPVYQRNGYGQQIMEAIELEPEPIVIEDKCVACSLCRNICQPEAVILTNKKGD